MQSLDPRVNRMKIDSKEAAQEPAVKTDMVWENYEVFHQKKSGAEFVHVGAVKANSSEMALILGKEQYARRLHTHNIWVVRTGDIFTFGSEEGDIFETTPEKKHREASGYKVRDKINEFKKRNKDE